MNGRLRHLGLLRVRPFCVHFGTDRGFVINSRRGARTRCFCRAVAALIRWPFMLKRAFNESPKRAFSTSDRASTGAVLLLLLGALVWQGCESCADPQKRAYGATCGRDSECSQSMCNRGYCTRPCTATSDCGADFCIDSRCHAGRLDLDGDGLSNARELAAGLDPLDPDTDGDGRRDDDELGPSPIPPDANADGVIDALQSNIKDSDGDCMVDAVDVAPFDSTHANLPAAADFCDEGVCAGMASAVTVTCRKDTPTHAFEVMGCVGCGCSHPTDPRFQAQETRCDGLDNDCDGQTDELSLHDGHAVGQACIANAGVCALPGAGGAAATGLVECGAGETAICSTGAGGSQSLAQAELCNGADDDCDGETDESFGYGTLPLSATCGPCGAKVHTCDGGGEANPSVVRCSGGGSGAGCASTTFSTSFELASSGRPLPRGHWTATWSPKWRRLLVYSGLIHKAAGPGVRADLWQLDTKEAAPWRRTDAQSPGPREGAALAWDEVGDRVLLVGGKHDAKTSAAIWSLNSSGEWTSLSAAAASDRVPPLPDQYGAARTHAVVVGDGTARWLIVFAAGQQQPVAVSLSSASDKRAWIAVAVPAAHPGHAALSGTVECATVVADQAKRSYVVVAGPVGKLVAVYMLAAGATKLTIHPVQNVGSAPPSSGFTCASDSAARLYLAGGSEVGQQTAPILRTGAITGTTPGSLLVQWKTEATTNDALARSGGAAFWDAADKRLLLLGGSRIGGPPSFVRRGRTDVHRLDANGASVSRVDVPTPTARVGQASGWSSVHGMCIAGGLEFDLPAAGDTRARLVPALDAWCAKGGQWQLVSEDVAPHAFGSAGIDPVSDRFVLVGGLALTPDKAVADVWQIWQAKLTFADDGSGTSPPTTGAVQSISLATGERAKHGSGPALAASASVVDPLRRRLLMFGGFSATKPTLELWTLEFSGMKWRELSAAWPGGALPAGDKPLPQYGSLVAYSAADDALIIAPGIVYRWLADKSQWGLTFQVYAPSGGGSLTIDLCHGDSKALTWVAKTLANPSIGALLIDTFEDAAAKPPTGPLYRPHFGQPAFVPWLHDTVTDRGLTLLPPPRSYAGTYADGKPCPDASSAQWTRAERPVVVVIGRCAGDIRLFGETRKFTTIPDAWILAASAMDAKQQRGWVFGGLRADGSPSSALWSVGQSCNVVQP